MRRVQNQHTVAGLSGAYIAVCIGAVFLLGWLFLDIDAATKFVFLQNGYLTSLLDVRFIAHYGLAAFAVIAHAGCGLRDVLPVHGVSESAVDRIFWSVAALAAITGLVIALALCAVRVVPT